MFQAHLWGSRGSVGCVWGYHIGTPLLPSQVLFALAAGEEDIPSGTHCGGGVVSGLGLAAAHPTGIPNPEQQLTDSHTVRLLPAGEGQQHFIGGGLS